MIYKLRKDTTNLGASAAAGLSQTFKLNSTAAGSAAVGDYTGILEGSNRQINLTNDSKGQFILHETTTTNGETKTYQLRTPRRHANG